MKKLLFSTMLFAVLLLSTLTFMSVLSMPASNIKDARKHAEEVLLPLEGVAGISHSEEPPRIIVYIEHEKYKSKIPDEIKGFKTEIIVTGRIKALALLQLESLVTTQYNYGSPVSRTGEVRPIVGGISCGVPEAAFKGKMAGTLGLIVKGPGGSYYVLSNAHVIAMDINAKFLPLGTPVLQPGTYDGGTTEDEIGKLYKYIKITFGPRGKNYADAAIAILTISESDYLAYEVLGYDDQITYTISGTYEVLKGNSVRKSGRTTGVTTNTVTDTLATVKVWYTYSKWAIFYDQILVTQPFIEAGDSGSLVDKDGAFVGLAFAGSDTIAVVCKAKYIIQGLGITI
ncbi:hypothetical protein KEJ25_05060 [Candidatus Bathyarchaeota archaeon]|nr:hypothetical protein [Candidatus Bathyarchaeota archaeon]